MPGKDEDEKLWRAYAKDIKPLKPVKIKADLPSTPPPAHPAGAKQPARRAAAKLVETGVTVADFTVSPDSHWKNKLQRGDIDIQARLDLHGKSQEEAQMALDDFLERQIQSRHRHLLVITGKGRDGTGVLRQGLKNWLQASEFSRRILVVRPAAMRHGGDGAFYVVLRRDP
ncbi:MAG: Smr/MutS family protein [Bdellovibrionales bacterium]